MVRFVLARSEIATRNRRMPLCTADLAEFWPALLYASAKRSQCRLGRTSMKAGSVAAALAALCALGSRALPQEPVSCGPAPTSQSSLGGIAVSDSSDIWAVGAYNDSAPGAPSLSIGMDPGGRSSHHTVPAVIRTSSWRLTLRAPLTAGRSATTSTGSRIRL